MRAGLVPDSAEANQLAEQHRDTFSAYLPISHEAHVCLGRMYEADPDFAAYYNRIHPGLVTWLRHVINTNAEAHGIDPRLRHVALIGHSPSTRNHPSPLWPRSMWLGSSSRQEASTTQTTSLLFTTGLLVPRSAPAARPTHLDFGIGPKVAFMQGESWEGSGRVRDKHSPEIIRALIARVSDLVDLLFDLITRCL